MADDSSMMRVLNAVKQFVADGGVSVRLHECRDCGVSLGVEAEACPACGSAEIAYYEW